MRIPSKYSHLELFSSPCPTASRLVKNSHLSGSRVKRAAPLFLPVSGWSGLLFCCRIWGRVCPLTQLPPWHKLPLLHIFSSFCTTQSLTLSLCFRCSTFHCCVQGRWDANRIQCVEAGILLHISIHRTETLLSSPPPQASQRIFWPEVLIELQLRNSHRFFFPFQILNLLLGYSRLMMLGQAQVYSEGTQSYVYTSPFSLKPGRKPPL